MTARELLEWSAFEQVFGPITVQERVDVAGALAAWSNTNGTQNIDAFVPRWDETGRGAMPTKTDEENIAFIKKLMTGKKRRRKKKRS